MAWTAVALAKVLKFPVIFDQDRTLRSLFVIASHLVDTVKHNERDHNRGDTNDETYDVLSAAETHHQEGDEKSNETGTAMVMTKYDLENGLGRLTTN